MSLAIKFNEGATPQNILEVKNSPNDSYYLNKSDVLYFTDRTDPTETAVKASLLGIPVKHLKVVAGAVVEMTQQEKDDIAAAETAAFNLNLKTVAKALYDGQQEQGQALRSLVKTLIDEINILRGWTVSFKSEAAQATSLADFKSRIATLSTLNDRTLAQAKTAIQSGIDNGDVDE